MSWCPRGVDLAANILSRTQGTVFVYFDPDVDGLFSGFFPCSVLKAQGIPYECYINENRVHGFFYPNIERLRNRTVIAVDFSITKDKLELLRQNNVKLINIDHHDISDTELVTYSFDNSTDIDGVVINNQYCFEPEDKRYLSGAGVVYYTLSNMIAGFDCELTRALVGLTLLSDIRPIENSEAEMFLRTCYTSKHPYMKYLVDVTRAEKDFNFGVPRMERNYADYTFNPRINALFRLNLGKVAIDLIFGKRPDFNLDEAREIQNQIQDFIKSNLRSPFNTNNMLTPEQTGTVNKKTSVFNKDGTESIQTQIMLSALDVYYMPPMHISESYELSNFIGLTCGSLKGLGKSCLAYIGSDREIIRGSFRGRFDKIDYLGIFRRYGFGNQCAGHKNAFGIHEISLDNIDFIGLNAEIIAQEELAARCEYENRIVPVDNLSVFLHSDLLKDIAMTNIYVRDGYRVYLKYKGTNASRRVRGKMFEFNIDGVTVKCFDETIDTNNGYILPIYDRGILTFYLKNIKK